MKEPQKDTQRAISAVKEIIDGRDIVADDIEITATLEKAVAAILIVLMRDSRKAAIMLKERLLQGVETRLATYNAKGPK